MLMSSDVMKEPVSRIWQAAGIASFIEVLLVAFVISATHTVPPATPTYTPLIIEPVVKEVEPLPEPPLPKPPEAVKPVVEPVKPTPVVRRTEAVPVPVTEPALEKTAEQQPVAVVEESRKQELPSVSTAAPQVEIVDPALAYNATLTMAVQATFRVPAIAASLGFKGRARIEFKLQDGRVSAIALIQSSTLAAVDRAALKAVSDAVYPAPPAALAGVMRTYQIWVECR